MNAFSQLFGRAVVISTDPGADLGDFPRTGLRRIVLVVDVGAMRAFERSDRVALRERRHPPAPDRRPDQVQRSHSRTTEEFAGEKAIESSEHEPLRPPRRAGHHVDVFGAESALADETKCVRAGAE